MDSHEAAAKVRRWFWCGVLGELYGGAIETRFARDIEQIPGWLAGGPAPRTVDDAFFEASRLDTLRTRNSAAYKGIHSLLMRRGARDWMRNREIDLAAFFDLAVDIHHVFPRKWCDDNGVDAGRRDSIVNKTALSWDTNRSIGGRSPGAYVRTIQDRAGVDDAALEDLLGEHLVALEHLRRDDFDAFYSDRKDRLIALIAEVIGKEVRRDDLVPEQVPEYDVEDALPDPDEELAAVLAQRHD